MEIPVNVDPIIEPRINASTKSAPARKKSVAVPSWKDHVWAIWFLSGAIVWIAVCISVFQYKYADIVNDANWLKRTNEEMTWRTERIKEDISRNQQQMEEYEERSNAFVQKMSDRIKNKRQKVVEN